MRLELFVAGFADAHRHCPLTLYDTKIAVRHAKLAPLCDTSFSPNYSLRRLGALVQVVLNSGSEIGGIHGLLDPVSRDRISNSLRSTLSPARDR
jgi:hypothetical protein